MTCTVLLSSAGRRVALLESFRAALRELGEDGRVLAADASPLSSAFHRADEGFLVPECTSSEFVPELLRLCSEHAVRLVVPTIDTELLVLAEHRHQFAAVGTVVAVSDPETIRIGMDKRRTHEWLIAHGFPTVDQAEVGVVLADPESWAYPMMLKPVRGSASVGVAPVYTAEQLRSAAEARDDVVVQSIARGCEHTVDVFVDGAGRTRCVVPRRRLETRGGEVSKGMTVREPSLERLARQMSEALPGAYGALNIQIFLEPESGACAVIEVNPRFGGGFPLSGHAGANFPCWMLEEVLGAPSTASADEWSDGVVMLRYDEAVYVRRGDVGL
jgi:carbamoyl-phosphate synthase large subunit